MEAYLHQLRRAELDVVRHRFAPGARVVEIGAGDGFQAALLEELGCAVTCYDVALPEKALHEVRAFDGRRLPEPDSCADIVFSSCVFCYFLEDGWMLSETRRVLKGGGKAVFAMGTASWRFWTAAAHYPWLLGFVLRKLFSGFCGGKGPKSDFGSVSGVDGASPAEPARVSSLRDKMKSLLFPKPLERNPGVLWELSRFREKEIRRVVEAAGFRVVEVVYPGVFYTGYMLLGGKLGLPMRRALAAALGSSSSIFIAEKI